MAERDLDPTEKKAVAVFLIILDGVFWACFIIYLRKFIGGQTSGILGAVWFGLNALLVGLIGIWFLVNLLMAGRMRGRLGSPYLILSPEAVPLGGVLQAEFTFSPLRRLAIREIKMTLECTESVQEGRSDGFHTHEEVIFAREEVLAKKLKLKMGQRHNFQTEFFIPSEAMHTFDASRNAVEWTITTRVRFPGRLSYTENRYFTVLPQVVRS